MVQSKKWNVNINTHWQSSDRYLVYYPLRLYLWLITIHSAVMYSMSRPFLSHLTNNAHLFSASRPLSQLQRVHGSVWAALQDGSRISESANRDCPADPEKVRLASQTCQFSYAEVICLSRKSLFWVRMCFNSFIGALPLKGNFSHYACVVTSSEE